MSSRFLSQEQQHNYGRYTGEPTSIQLANYFHLDDTAKTLVQKRRGDHNRLGFAIQLCTVRFLGTFLIDPIDVPQEVINYLASQLEIKDVTCLPQYLLRSNTRWEHTLTIKKHYGYRDFSEQPGHWRLLRWLYQRAWTGGESPSMLFDLTTARLVEQKILLPGVTVLSRLISTVRERVANRTWKILSRLPNSKQIENLEALIVIGEKARLTPLEQLRKSPTRRSAPSLVNALNRLVTIRTLGINQLNVGKIPPIRFKTLSKTAFTLRAQAVARMSTERRIATLVAWAYVMEAIAIDDALDVLNLLAKDILAKSQKDGKKNRLRTLKDLDGAALQLATACKVLVNPKTEDNKVREEVWQKLTLEQLTAAITSVEELARPPEDNYYAELIQQWRAVRRFLPKLLSIIDFEGNQAGQKILEAWQFLQSIEGNKKPKMDSAPLKIVDKKWATWVIDENGSIDRRAYTFCVLEKLLDEFSHLNESFARVKDLPISICAILIAQGCNIGLSPLVRKRIPALTRGRLSWVEQNYFRPETIIKANARLVDAQREIPIVKSWGGGEVASADGMRFVVPVQTLNAGANSKYFNRGRGITYYNYTSNQFTGFHGLVVPGTLRDSLVVLVGLLEQQTGLRPRELMTDTSGYSDVVFGLFWLLGYQFSPRLADAGSARFWRLDSSADYGLLDNLARQTVKTDLIEQNWDDLLRVAGSLKLGTVSATEIMRALHRGKKPSTIAKAIGELGKITKTLYLLNYVDDEAYRRRILTQLNRGESRHSLARAIFYGRRGEIRQRYREGQEEQLGTLGLVTNVLVLWNTYYMDAAIARLQKEGWEIKEEDKARLSPLSHSHINMLGRYQFNLPEELKDGALRPLRDVDALDELGNLDLW